MVPHTAVGIDPTEAWTGIQTLSVDTCFVLRTLRVDHTLRSTVGRRPDHLRQTGTVTRGAEVPGRVGVGPAGVWLAGVLHYGGGD